MVLHLGEDVFIPLDKLIVVLNGRAMTQPAREYVERARKERRYTPCGGKIKSYAVCQERGRERIYASPIAASTLLKRLNDAESYRTVFDLAVLTTQPVEG